MNCDYQTLFTLVVGVSTSQYFVWQYVKNSLCLKHFDYTLQQLWRAYYQGSSCDNFDLWKQNRAPAIQKRLEMEQQRLVLLFYIWNMIWVFMLFFCLPRIWALSVLSVITSYSFVVLLVSYATFYVLSVQLEGKPEVYIPHFYI